MGPRTPDGTALDNRKRTHDAMELRAPNGTAQNKRARAWNWHPKIKQPKWPDPDKPEDWTAEDVRSAETVNALMLDSTGHEKHAKPPEIRKKYSRLIQALDLAAWVQPWKGSRNGYAASFNDLEIETDDFETEFSLSPEWCRDLFLTEIVQVFDAPNAVVPDGDAPPRSPEPPSVIWAI
jgi:hypothetical protein